MPHKIILDTDIGSDIDDAVCLAYLLAQPACDLLGITTVSGQPEQRARLASAVCRYAQREVPIFPGLEQPRRGRQQQPDTPQAAALERWPHAREFPAGQAIEFMRQTIHRHPGEVTLLAIGPLTNVAALIEADPEVPHLLRGLTLMGGLFSRLSAEWNIQCDPHAAAQVYDTTFPEHRSIGLDVTLQVQLPAAAAHQRLAAPGLRLVADLAEYYFAQHAELTFHDPLAAATLFVPDLCGFERGTITVVTAEEAKAGITLWAPTAAGRHLAALSVKPDLFLEHYFGLFPA